MTASKSDLAERIARLSPTKRALYALRMELHGSGSSADRPTPRAAGAEPATSFAQERMWFLAQWAGTSASYNRPAPLRVSGHLDVARVRAALASVVDRHVTLRATFSQRDRVLAQTIHAQVAWEFPLIDVSGEADPELAARAFMFEHARQPFDLARGPLFRAALVRLGDTTHVLALVFHHITFDGWSARVLASELAASYGAASVPAPQAIDYADYAAWQRARFERGAMAGQLAYWREQLADIPDLALPTDHPRPAVASDAGARVAFALPAAVVESLETICRAEGATMYMALLAAFQILLARTSQQTDIAVGSPIAGRTSVEIEPLIGYFANTLVMRTSLADRPTFRELLARVRTTAIAAYTNQELPFEQLVAELAPARRLDSTPLFQVTFSLQDPIEPVEAGGVRFSSEALDLSSAKFDVDLTLIRGDTVAGYLEYRTELFERPTIERMAEHYRVLLQSIVANPERAIDALPMLAPDERHRVLVAWNDTAVAAPDRCVHEQVEAQVDRTPDAVAVVFEDTSLTYRELDNRANQLAHHLQSLGVGPDSIVGIVIERSLEMVIGLLGILKAGGAYLPIDPTYPGERIAFLLEDARVSILVTSEALREGLQPYGAKTVCLDDRKGPLHRERTDAPRRAVAPSNLAYVIYTSGSTGKPKGVMIHHRGLANYLAWGADAYDVEHGSGAPVHSSLSFDLTVTSLILPLVCGRRVVLVDNVDNVGGLAEALREHDDFTLVKITPTHLELLANQLAPEQAAGRTRRFVIGGENLTAEELAFFRKHAPETTLVNEYGPTETVVGCCVYEVPRDHPIVGTVPIGRPIANTRLYVLDSRLETAPIGVPGELHIAGVGLARGYLNRAGMTGERFLPDPFATEPGERMYRTGDLVRWRADGLLEFLGRIDHQVKVRGFRIELGEIEATLAQHADVKDVVVIAREDARGDKQLVAYLVAAKGVQPEIAELRGAVARALPEYMVPAAFVWLDAMPLTPNGKLDREALPAPELGDAGLVFREPKTPEQELLAGTWAQLLGVERVGLDDHFFHLGGHSLLATRLVSRVREVFGVELPLRGVFEAPTLGAQAERIATARRAGRVSPIARLSRGGELPLSFAQERLWLIDQITPNSALYNVPIIVRLAGMLDIAVLEQTLVEIHRRHETLRSRFVNRGGAPAVVISDTPFALRRVDVETAAAATRSIDAEITNPFDLSAELPWRALLVTRADEDDEHVLVVTMHHIVSDGWSSDVLADELRRLYVAGCGGEASPLAPLPLQYADFAAWQRTSLSDEVLEPQLVYWKRQLAWAPALLELPLDRPRPVVASYRGGRHVFALSPALSRDLEALSRAHGVTLYMTMLAAFQTLLHRSSRQDDILVGSPIAGRARPEVEGLIGCFVNTLVLRADLSANPTFAELLAQVRETALGAYAHQDLPFEKLVDALNPERDLGHAPIVQAMFQLDRPYASRLELSGATATTELGDTRLAKFDLHVAVVHDDSLAIRITYARDLFDDATIERMAEHYRVLLDSIVADPDRRVDEGRDHASVANGRELANRLEAPDRPLHANRAGSLHRLVEAQVTAHPDARAVVFDGAALTYAELNDRANRLAHYLISRGVGPDVIVGVSMELGLDLVVALLAVLKAGGAYLPLDPKYPANRIAFMLDDCRVPVLISNARVDVEFDGVRIELTADAPAIANEPSANVAREVDPENLAYIIYTSGSTGRPKGVLVPHDRVTRLLRSTEAWFAFDARDVWTFFHSYAFDFSVWEIWGALSYGGTVVVVPEHVRRSPEELLALLAQERVTVLNQTPSAFRNLITATTRMTERTPLRLRFVIFGGEALELDSLAPWFARYPDGPRLVNMYGITETTVHVTFRSIDPVECGTTRGSPIGVPIPDLEIHLLDASRVRVRDGKEGEIYVGGAGIARGYHRRAALTAERFVPDPFSGRPGARLYKTGDLARRLPDGSFDYLGRNDAQVKIRGYRIETGEIAATLRTHPNVRDAAVVAAEIAGDRRLVAYVVLSEPTPNEALRDHLGEALPPYMVPGAFVWLDALPLTPNGKLDRKALPAPDGYDTGVVFRAPQTPEQELLAGAWAQLLGVARVGIDDNFFHLGGHSLLAARLVSRVRDVFGVELPLREVFLAPTLGVQTERIVAARRSGLSTEPPIALLPRGGELPVSFAQQRLWLIDQIAPGSALYNVPIVFRIAGALDVGALEQTLLEIHRRHEVLRSRFVNRGGVPTAVVSDAAFALHCIDVETTPDPQGSVRDHVDAEIVRPFDLAAELPWRALLIRTRDDDHVLVVTMHHIVSDGWSSDLFADELGRTYGARREGRGTPLSPLPVQYADFATWQRTRLSDDVLDRQLAYWKRQLAGAPALLDLPLDRPRPVVASYRGGRHVFALSPALSRDLETLSRTHGVTLYMMMLAAFQTLLHRSSRQDDVLVGSPIAGRTRREVEGLIGCFVNTLVLRADISANPTFVELLAQVRETALAAYAHQDLPFEKLVDELNPERDLGHTPLFQAAFQLERAYTSKLELPNAIATVEPGDTRLAKFDLGMAVIHDDALAIRISFARDLFDDATIERIGEHYRVLLESIVADPERRVDALPMLQHDERNHVLVAWNDTAVALPEGDIFELFEGEVARAPDAIAVISADTTLSYSELSRRAGVLAGHLVALGVNTDTRVAVCLPRSVDAIVAYLAILGAGGAYVPIDPEYPAQRITEMLAIAGVEVVITTAPLAHSLPSGVRVVHLETLGAPAPSRLAPRRSAGVDALCYVMFTSGSTGAPKAVATPHRGVVRLVKNSNYFTARSDDVFLWHASPLFDASTLELWGALLNGARVVVPPGFVGPAEVARTVREHSVTVLALTAAVFKLVADDHLDGLGSVRALLAGGDVVPPAQIDRARRALPRCQLINAYGPTENTCITCGYAIPADGALAGSIPIGSPIANTQMYVLDAGLQPVGIGIVGELYTGGAGLARGYLGRPDLTAERFVPDPYGAPGERLYRTGDLGRWLPSGDLEFCGRVDHQVKLRGFRIEPGEIEVALARHAEIKEATVAVREERRGDKRLVAYLVGAMAARPSTSDLRSFLGQSLPDYMVPSAFVWLDALPLTPHGKLDRKALPAPELGDTGVAFREPQTPEQELLAGTWAQLLEVGRVGLDDNFFHLGGHSLLATRLVSRVRELFGIELPLRGVFEAPTLGAQAERIAAARRAGPSTAQPIALLPRGGELPLSFAQQRLWLIDQITPGNALYNSPLVFWLAGELDVAMLEQALAELHHRHETLRSRFVNRGGHPAIVVTAAPFTLRRVDVASADEVIDAEIARPFDLATELPWRGLLIRTSDDEHVLVVTMHHIVTDGWSSDVFADELSRAYVARREGRVSPLAPLPLQYADFAAWQRTWLSDGVLDRQLAYWKRQLAGAPALLELPLDRPRPAVASHRGGSHERVLTPALSRALEMLSRTHGVTLYMTMLAVFQTLLHRSSRQDDILVGSPIAGRTRRDIEGLIGCFVNTVVLRADFSANPTFVELLGQVRETALAAYAHQDLPFEKLVDELNPERDLGHTPIVQAMFQLERPYASRLELGGVTVTTEPHHTRLSKFDLSMAIVHDDAIAIRISFARDLFDDATIVRMAEHHRVLLESIVADPDRRIDELPMLAADEEHRVLVAWNDTAVAAPDRCVHEQVEAQVDRTPDAIAIACDDAQLTYRELDDRANQLAHRLVALGVGPEIRVGICAERSIEMVIGLLGVLKAGGAYVPLDPSYPAERLAFMIEDAGIAVLLAQAPYFGVGATHTHVIALQRELGTESTRRLSNVASPEQLAYVIYTSGSTGRPKGVAVPQRGLAHLVAWHRAAYRVSGKDRATLFAAPGFDASTWELWPYLVAGATLLVVPEQLRGSPTDLRDFFVAEGVTIGFVPTPVAEPLVALPWPAGPLRSLLTGGDRLVRRPPPATPFDLVNHYGPTEYSVVTTAGRVDGDGPASPPIGRPIANTRTILLDAALHPVGIGIPGEIHISGAGLARGYLGRPGLTAERFVPDPYGAPGERLYRTGDLGRWLPSGELEFCGRLDHQVKIRGFRIELGEIEAVLARREDINDVVVVAHDDEAGEKWLAAYAVGTGDVLPTVAALRSFLRRSLPDYMVPSAFVWLDALPLTPNGKLDRKALPAPTRSTTDQGHVAPRTPTELALAAIWARVLGVERVGVENSFFDLGGHSLLVMRLVAGISQELGVELTPRTVFEHATIAAQAEQLDELRRVGVSREDESAERQLVDQINSWSEPEVATQLAEWSKVALEPAPAAAAHTLSGPRRDLLERLVAQHRIDAHVSRPLARRTDASCEATFAQRFMWNVNELGDPVRLGNAQAYAIRGPLDLDAMGQAVAALAERQAALRTVFALDGDRLIQTVRDRGADLAVLDLSSASNRTAQVRELFAAIGRPHDLGRQTFRAQLVRLDDHEHVLLVAPHHIVLDGFSNGVFWSDLTALYRAALSGTQPDLENLELRFADHCFWQTTLVHRPVGKRQLDFWASAVAGYEDLELPGDLEAPSRARGAVIETYPMDAVPFVIEGASWDAVTGLCSRLNVLPYSVIATALFLLLRSSRLRDVCAMSSSHHRSRPGSEPLIGNFVTPYPLRIGFDDDATLERAVLHCDHTVLVHREHQGVAPLSAAGKWSEVTRYNLNYLVASDHDVPIALGDAHVEKLSWAVHDRQTTHDLALYARQYSSGVRGPLVYNAQRFSPALAARVVARFQDLVHTIATEPSQRVSALSGLELVGGNR